MVALFPKEFAWLTLTDSPGDGEAHISFFFLSYPSKIKRLLQIIFIAEFEIFLLVVASDSFFVQMCVCFSSSMNRLLCF